MDIDLLVQYLSQFLLPFFRIAAFFTAVPIFGNQLVPMRIRLMLAFVAAITVAPNLSAVVLPLAFSVNLFIQIFIQLLIGFLLGFFVQVFFHIFVLAGQMIAMQMGLGFASMVDPTNGVSVAVVSQFYVILVTLLFLAMNGHLVALEVMIESFRQWPIGGEAPVSSVFYSVAQSGVWMFSSALLLALPAVTAILIVNFAFGVMTRAAPQLNIFSLGFPFTLVFGIFILWAALAGFFPQYQGLSEQAFAKLHALYLQ